MTLHKDDKIELLKRVPAFADLGETEIAEIAEVAVPRRFEANYVIFREGDTSDTCYVVNDGSARALRHHSDGRAITLATFGPGDIFGELAMFDDEDRSATVETISAVEAIAILGSDMRRMLREHPDISVKLVSALGRRLRQANDRLASQSFQTVQSRVAKILLEIAPEQRDDKPVIIDITQADIAKLAGSSRESASRFMAVLERAGAISQGRGKITVNDCEAIKRYVY